MQGVGAGGKNVRTRVDRAKQDPVERWHRLSAGLGLGRVRWGGVRDWGVMGARGVDVPRDITFMNGESYPIPPPSLLQYFKCLLVLFDACER